MNAILKHIILFLVFSALFVLPSLLLPIPLEHGTQTDLAPTLLLTLLLIDLLSIIYLINRLNLWGAKLFFAVTMVFWGFQTFMTQIETWYFREAMPAITDEVLMKLFLDPLLTAVTFIPLAIWILGKWRQPEQSGYHLNLNTKWREFLLLAIAYMIIYYLFGYYVAWQFEDVRMFYSGGPEKLGFFDQLQHNIRQHNFLFPFQILRGFLWILFGLPVALYLKGSKTEKIVACVFMYSVLTAIPLVIDNPFMPSGVRMAHLLEVSTSNGLFGLLVGFAFAKYQSKE